MFLLPIIYFFTIGYILLLNQHDGYEKPKRKITILLNILLALLVLLYLTTGRPLLFFYSLIFIYISNLPFIQGDGSYIIGLVACLFIIVLVGISLTVFSTPKKEKGIKKRYNFLMGFIWIYMLIMYALFMGLMGVSAILFSDT